MKYIDAEKLYKKVDELMAHYAKSEEDMDEEGNTDWATYYQGKKTTCSKVLDIINSLQQEQQKCIYGRTLEERKRACKYCSAACNARIDQEQPETDLETEIEEYINNFFYTEPSTADFPPEDIMYSMDRENIKTFARHFYELGQKEMRERIANPQYNQEVIAKMKSEYPTEEFKARKEE